MFTSKKNVQALLLGNLQERETISVVSVVPQRTQPAQEALRRKEQQAFEGQMQQAKIKEAPKKRNKEARERDEDSSGQYSTKKQQVQLMFRNGHGKPLRTSAESLASAIEAFDSMSVADSSCEVRVSENWIITHGDVFTVCAE